MRIVEKTEGERWMNEAARAATGSLCHRAKCGAIIVADDEIIAEGFNAPPQSDDKNRHCMDKRAFTNKPKYDRTCCMHAEWRAIEDALKRNAEKLAKSQLYYVRVDEAGAPQIAGEPCCTVCSRWALDVGIREFVLLQESGIVAYPTDEYDQISYKFINRG